MQPSVHFRIFDQPDTPRGKGHLVRAARALTLAPGPSHCAAILVRVHVQAEYGDEKMHRITRPIDHCCLTHESHPPDRLKHVPPKWQAVYSKAPQFPTDAEVTSLL